MCGLVGIAGDLEYKDEATLKRLLVFDYFRGPDSTGLAALRKSGAHHIVKMATHPLDLFDTKKFTEALSGYTSTVFLGHNRLATKGKVNGLNAHPYEYGHIIGAHNGTLDRGSWKRLNDVLGYETDVDSQAIFAAMEKIGVEETVKLLEEGRTSTDGAWALTWIDLKENTINFLRNKHRPLWYAYTKDFKKVFWASEWPMIQAATGLSAAGYDMYQDPEGFSYFQMEENWWYRFDLAELAKGGKDRPKPRVKIVKGREPAPVTMGAAPFAQGVTTYGGNSPNRLTWSRGGTNSNRTTTSTSKGGAASTTVPEVYPIQATESKPFGDYLTKAQFDHFAQDGCSWCHVDVNYHDEGVTIYEQTGHILCPKCAGNNGASRIYTSRAEVEGYVKRKAA